MREHATTVQVLTAQVPAAIATVCVDGPQALEIVNQHLRTSSGLSRRIDAGQAKFSYWAFQHAPLPPEHVVVLARNAAIVEIHCHGGTAITQAIVNELMASGCQRVLAPAISAADEAIDPCSPAAIEHAAMIALSLAPTAKVTMILLDQMQGALAAEIAQLKAAIQRRDAALATQLRSQLIARGELGLKLMNPWRLTLAGPPNVGKSSLMNALCGTRRVLVHDQPGTTRDAIDTPIVIADWLLVVTDTAGIRETSEDIEQQGIATARSRWQQADIGLLVVDATLGWTEAHDQLRQQRSDQQLLVVLNKIDRLSPDELDAQQLQINTRFGGSVVLASALSAEGMQPLINAIRSLIDAHQPPPGSAVPFTLAQLNTISNL